MESIKLLLKDMDLDGIIKIYVKLKLNKKRTIGQERWFQAIEDYLWNEHRL